MSGPLVVEQGTEQAVREAVAEAMAVLAPAGGFILSPVDNVRASLARARMLSGDVLADEAVRMEQDLEELAVRGGRVRSLSDRFSGVELSPQVTAMMRLAERRLVAV